MTLVILAASLALIAAIGASAGAERAATARWMILIVGKKEAAPITCARAAGCTGRFDGRVRAARARSGVGG